MQRAQVNYPVAGGIVAPWLRLFILSATVVTDFHFYLIWLRGFPQCFDSLPWPPVRHSVGLYPNQRPSFPVYGSFRLSNASYFLLFGLSRGGYYLPRPPFHFDAPFRAFKIPNDLLCLAVCPPADCPVMFNCQSWHESLWIFRLQF
jgi:hypothetical protein